MHLSTPANSAPKQILHELKTLELRMQPSILSRQSRTLCLHSWAEATWTTTLNAAS